MIFPKLPEGVLLTRAVLAKIGPDLLPALEAWYRCDGRQVPQDVRKELTECAEAGRKYLVAEVLERTEALRLGEKGLAKPPSPPAESKAMYNTKVVAHKLGITPRAAQYRAKTGALPSTRSERGDLLFDAATVDRRAKEVK